jgi:hypothetical protein
MLGVLMLSMFAAVTHGAVVVPLLWVIGVVLLVAGVIALVRGGILAGVVLIILGILLGGLNVF